MKKVVFFLVGLLIGSALAIDGESLQAYFTTSTISGVVPLTIIFDANASKGADLQYRWNFRDGTSAEGSRVEHTFRYAGSYDVVLTVYDDKAMHSVYKNIYVLPTESVLDKRPETVQHGGPIAERIKYLEWLTEHNILNFGLEKVLDYMDRRDFLDFVVVNQVASNRSWVSFSKRAYSGQDNYPVAHYSGGNVLIDVSTGKRTVFPERINGLLTSYATFAPDAKTMVISQGGNLYISEVETANPQLFFKGSDDFSYSIAALSFKDDGSELALYVSYAGLEESTPIEWGILPSYVLRIPLGLRNGDMSDATIVREYTGSSPNIYDLVWQGDDVIILTTADEIIDDAEIAQP